MDETGSCGKLSAAVLREAAGVVQGGGIVAFPTETFYGLGGWPLNERTLARIFDLKGRSTTGSPVLVLVRSRADLEALVADITPLAERLMTACWPGPLTLVFRASAGLPPLLTAGTGTIGIRLSAHPDVQRLLEATGGMLTGTSANRSGSPPVSTAEEVRRFLGGGVDLILDGGPTSGGLPSTVVDTTVTPVRVLREGRVARAALISVLGSLAA